MFRIYRNLLLLDLYVMEDFLYVVGRKSDKFIKFCKQNDLKDLIPPNMES